MKPFFLFLTGLTFFDARSQEPGKYSIEFKIEDAVNEEKAYLRFFTPHGPWLDSSVSEKGKFYFSGKLPDKLTIGKIYLSSDPKNRLEVWIEASETKIKARKDLSQVSYDGSLDQKEFSDLQEDLKIVRKKNIELDDRYNKAAENGNNIEKDRLVNEEYPALFRVKQSVLENFIRNHPSSLISAAYFEEFAGDGEMDLTIVEPVFDLLDNKIKNHAEVQKVARLIDINKIIAPGMSAIEFSQSDTSGKNISLTSFRGKYLLIDFWAGWCVPCRAENPLLVKLYNQYRNKGFEIIGVSLDGERKRWTDAIRNDKLTWTQLSDLQIFENAVAKMYGITSIPQNILIGPDGVIIARNLRGSALVDRMAVIFK